MIPLETAIVRIGLVLEFLAALMATFTLWSQVGGQYHLDLMPWYWKLLLGMAIAFATVKATVAACLQKDRPWNRYTWRWLGVILVLFTICGALTYYTHLYEPDEGDQDDSNSTQQAVEVKPIQSDARWFRAPHSTSRTGPMTQANEMAPTTRIAVVTTKAQ